MGFNNIFSSDYPINNNNRSRNMDGRTDRRKKKSKQVYNLYNDWKVFSCFFFKHLGDVWRLLLLYKEKFFSCLNIKSNSQTLWNLQLIKEFRKSCRKSSKFPYYFCLLYRILNITNLSCFKWFGVSKNQVNLVLYGLLEALYQRLF